MSFKQVIDLLDKGLVDKTAEMANQFDFNTKSCLTIHTLIEKSLFQDAEIKFKEFEKSFTPESEIDKLRYFAVKNELYYRLYQYDILEISLTEAHDLILKINHTMDLETHFWYYLVTRVQAFYYHIKGNYHQAIETYIAMSEIAEKANMIGSIGTAYGLLGEVYSEIGDFEKALESYIIALKRFRSVNNVIDSAYVNLYIGIIHEKRGDFNQAKQAYETSLDFFNQSDVPDESYKTKMRVGYLQLLQGDVDGAVLLFNEIYPYVKKNGYVYQEADLKHFLGIASFLKNEYDDAVQKFTEALELRRKSENQIEISHILFHLINAAIFAKSKDLIETHFDELKKLSESSNSPIISIRAKLIEASLKKDAPRLIEKVKAQQIYEEIVNDTTVEEYQIKIIALINLCDLLVFEIKNSNDKDLLKEAYSYIDQIQIQADNMNSTSLNLEASLLRSKFYQCEFKFNEAISLLENSKKIAEDNGLMGLKQKIELQLENLLKELEKWNEFSDTRKNIKDRIEEIEVKEYLNELNKLLRSN